MVRCVFTLEHQICSRFCHHVSLFVTVGAMDRSTGVVQVTNHTSYNFSAMSVGSDWNFTTTDLDAIEFISTSVITTIWSTINTDNNILPDPNGKGPKKPKGPKGQPIEHSENIEWKQTLGILSLVLLTSLIIFALLQIIKHKQCLSNFKKVN